MNTEDWSKFAGKLDDGTVFVGCELDSQLPLMKAEFKSRRKKLRTAYMKIEDLPIIDSHLMEKYVYDYAEWLMGAAYVKLKEAQKSDHLRSNEGTGRQHWIPACYMRAFSKEYPHPKYAKQNIDMTLKVNKRNLPTHEMLTNGNTRFFTTELVSLDEIDFKEAVEEKGNFYTPYFEILLSLLEDDYANVKLAPRPKNLWDFIVLAIFFLLLSLRTKEERELRAFSKNEEEQMKDLRSNLVHDFPKRISKLEIRLLSHKIAIPLEYQETFRVLQTSPTSLQDLERMTAKQMMLPFNQKPYLRIREGDDEFSLWSICTPKYLIWLRHKETSYVPTKNSLNYILRTILESNDVRDSYFHPDDDYWDYYIFSQEHLEKKRNNVREFITALKMAEYNEAADKKEFGITFRRCAWEPDFIDTLVNDYKQKNMKAG